MNRNKSQTALPPSCTGGINLKTILWAVIFFIAVAATALVINVFLVMKNPPANPANNNGQPQQPSVEIWSPDGRSTTVPSENGNPLIPRQPAKETETPASDIPDDGEIGNIPQEPRPASKPKPKKDKEKEGQKNEPQETPLEPINKKPANGERTLDPINRGGEKSKPVQPKPRQPDSHNDMDNLF
ncbi:MAG: hypothetical protein Q3966_01260 [Neisseria sp.]|nr:hypothetical protein [Neisseria sp.]